jgi:hypothetical protein
MVAVFVSMFIAGVIAVIAAVNVAIAPENHLPRTVAEAEASAPALLAVREAAFSYVLANGVSDGVLAYNDIVSLVRAPIATGASYSSYVSGGFLYVWAGGVVNGPEPVAVQPGGRSIARQMFELSGGSRLVGFSDGGVFTHPIYGATSINLPAQIPNGAAVAIRPI